MTEKPSDNDLFCTFSFLAQKWNIDSRDRAKLLSVNEHDYNTWTNDRVKLNVEQRDKISHLSNIYLGLQATFGDGSPMADLWITRRNLAFDDKPPLDIMLKCGLAGIVRVREYIENLQ